MTDSPGNSMIGRRIGHYLVEHRLGEGGMGVVFSARDEKLHRAVALKMIRAGVGDPHLRERFWREARAAASLNHPGICQVHDVRDEQGEMVIVTRPPRVHRGARTRRGAAPGRRRPLRQTPLSRHPVTHPMRHG